jgi:hypothetical protein
MPTEFNSFFVQLGAIGLLLAVFVWWLKELKTDLNKWIDRYETLFKTVEALQNARNEERAQNALVLHQAAQAQERVALAMQQLAQQESATERQIQHAIQIWMGRAQHQLPDKS